MSNFKQNIDVTKSQSCVLMDTNEANIFKEKKYFSSTNKNCLSLTIAFNSSQNFNSISYQKMVLILLCPQQKLYCSESSIYFSLHFIVFESFWLFFLCELLKEYENSIQMFKHFSLARIFSRYKAYFQWKSIKKESLKKKCETWKKNWQFYTKKKCCKENEQKKLLKKYTKKWIFMLSFSCPLCLLFALCLLFDGSVKRDRCYIDVDFNVDILDLLIMWQNGCHIKRIYV